MNLRWALTEALLAYFDAFSAEMFMSGESLLALGDIVTIDYGRGCFGYPSIFR